MTSIDLAFDPDWVPTVCTLPTIEQPLRLTEFDSLFTALTDVEWDDASHATLTLVGSAGLAARTQDLADRETACCSFFTFTVVPTANRTGEAVRLSITVPEVHAEVLRALVGRAEQQVSR